MSGELHQPEDDLRVQLRDLRSEEDRGRAAIASCCYLYVVACDFCTGDLGSHGLWLCKVRSGGVTVQCRSHRQGLFKECPRQKGLDGLALGFGFDAP